MKVLVTGCAGFVGSHVAEELLIRGDEVIGVDILNDFTYSSEIKKKTLKILQTYERFNFYQIDISDEEQLKKVDLTYDSVIHLAALPGVGPSIKQPQKYLDVNVRGTLNLLNYSKHVDKFVYISSSSVYGANKKIPFNEKDSVDAQLSPYAWTKRSGELLCKYYHKQYGINFAILRLFNVYGPRGRPDMAIYLFTDAILNDKPIKKFGDGTMSRDWTFIDDTKKGIISALDHKCDYEIFNLGNNTPVTLNDLVSTIEEVIGKKAKIEQHPEREGDVPITYANIEKAKNLLGYSPSHNFREGFKKFFNWYKNET